MALRSRSFRLGHARRGAVVASYYTDAIAFPWPGAAADLDFIRRQYRWNNASRTEADFTTLVLNGATWEARGLNLSTATVNPDITITLAALGLAMPPCVCGVAGYIVSAPSVSKSVYQIDDGTNAERFAILVTSTPFLNSTTIDGGVVQANQTFGTSPALATRFGGAVSIQLNEMLAAFNGVDLAADLAGTMPTVTTLRLGYHPGVGTFAPIILSRLVIFTAVKIQADVDALSAQMRDAR